LVVKIKRIVALILIVTIAASCVAGCLNIPDRSVNDVDSIKTFRDVPGITSEEIEAIEALLQTRDSFSFGALLSTYAFTLPDGSNAGFFPLLCELLTDLFERPFSVEFYDWDELNENLNDYTTDFTGELTPTPERRLTYFMTSAIAELSISAFFNMDAVDIVNAQSLNGLKVGFWSQSITEHYILLAYPDLEFDSVDIFSEADAAKKLESGEIDAFITPSVDAYAFLEYPFITGREVFPFVYAVASMTTANPELAPVISVVEKYLTGDGFFQIHDLHIEGRRDFAAYRLGRLFTDEEKEYINYLNGNGIKTPVIFEASRYPVAFYNEADNEYQGIARDILTEITLLTGMEFEVVSDRNSSWSELLKMLSSGQAAMIADLLYSEEQGNEFLWAQEPYLVSNYAFISKIDTPYTDFLIPILDTGVVEGSVFEALYHRFFPDSGNLILFDSNSDALNALEADEIDLILTSDYLLLYQTNYREKSGYKINILLSDLIGESFFGFNKDYEVLCSIISKTQRFVNTERIALSWTSRVFDFERRMSDERADNANQRAILFSVLIVILLGFLTVLTVLLRNNRKMIRELRHTSAELETAIVQTNAASKAKSDFLSNMSHEIRTPLNAIVGMIAIGKKADDIDKKNHALSEIGDASSHLLGIINDVLDMAKIEADKLELMPVNFAFEKMLKKVLSTIQYRANEKELIMTTNVDSDIPHFIIGDEQRLSQILMNLLSNAVKFTPVGGKINLDAALSKRIDDTIRLRIEVSDSGIGISPEQQKKLFDAFEQANTGVSREYGGTGLGLAIVKRIVELMGGRIWVKSELGKGAKFIFTVQVSCGYNEYNLPDEHNEADSVGAFDGKRLLVAEDVEINSKILIALLSDTGIVIDCVENGKEALDAIEANPDLYDIVFMDLQMPQMNGLEATRHIRALPGNTREKLPIIAMTANVFKDDVDNCIAAGMNDHLSKPLDVELVIKKLHEYLDVQSKKD